MNVYGKNILAELEKVNSLIQMEQEEKFVENIDCAKRIFLTGAGRSGLIIKTFANRLMHLGYNVHILGDVTTPHTKPGDLLIISSGSGETKGLISQAQNAKNSQMNLALITTNKNSSLGKLADIILEIPVASKVSKKTSSIQPMGSLYEQYTLMLFDSIVLYIMKQKHETNETMYARHANLE